MRGRTSPNGHPVPIAIWVQFLLLGLGAGAVYAALGLGLVLTYRASGVVNLAHGAVTMYATYVFVALRADGHLLLPLPGPPGQIHVGVMPTAAAAVIAVATATAFELLCYWLVFRPLRDAPALPRVVATVGLMVAVQAVVTLQRGADSVVVSPVLPNRPLTVAGVRVPEDRLLLAGIVAVAAAALWALYRYTPFGIASRAAAEDEVALALAGWSPERVAAANWALSGALAALAGIFVGPITTLDPVTFTLLVVPALAAALVGGLDSFGITVVAALALGMAQSELVQVQLHASWLSAAGVGQALPLVAIVVVAAARGALLPDRSLPIRRRLPEVGRATHPYVGVAALLVAGAVALAATHGVYRLALATSIVGAVLCLSIVALTGYLGQVSLAQMALAGVAGFALAKVQQPLGVPFPVDALLAASVAALVGVVLGVPALRVRGAALAVATLAGGVAVEAVVFQDPRLTGGFAGTHVHAPGLGAWHLGPGSGGSDYPRLAFGLLALVVLSAVAAGLSWVRTHRLGRRLLAVRANERAAAASGVALTSTKLAGFALSSFVAGLGGALLGWEQGRLSFGSFDVFVSLAIVAVTCIGGVGRVSGGVVGGALVGSGLVFTALDQAAGIGRYQLLASGFFVVVAAVLAPDGLTGLLAGAWRRRSET